MNLVSVIWVFVESLLLYYLVFFSSNHVVCCRVC